MRFTKANSGKKVSGNGYNKEILLNDIDLVTSAALAQIIIVGPNTTVASHYHKNTTEIFYFLENPVTFIINNTEINCEPGDILVCEKGEMHTVKNNSDNIVKYLAVKTQNDNDTFWE